VAATLSTSNAETFGAIIKLGALEGDWSILRETEKPMNLKKALGLAVGMALGTGLASAGPIITPTFDTTITSNASAAAIEGAIDAAISMIEGLYSNSVTIPVTFTNSPAASSNLESNTGFFYSESYASYVSQLEADAVAHPENTVLATALANLPVGNDANGSSVMALTAAQLTMLGVPEAGHAVVNINSLQSFAFSGPVPSTEFDAIGGIEHELDEVLGGGGGGSTLNNCITNPPFFCGKFGPLDLYRYSAPSVSSYATFAATSSYFSVDGGVTSIVAFNQNGAGDYADFSPACGTGGGTGELIQNAVNCRGQDEAYTTSSPEFEMLESIGWDPVAATAPEPGTMATIGGGLAALAFYLRRRNA
jgi:hypothetical protein